MRLVEICTVITVTLHSIAEKVFDCLFEGVESISERIKSVKLSVGSGEPSI